MTTLASETIKTITISHRTILLNEGHDTEGPYAEPDKTSTFYLVEVSIMPGHPTDHDGASANFDTLAEAEAYAAEVCQRPLKPFTWGGLLTENR